MSDELVPIYTAGSLEQANLLRNVLSEERIQAVVGADSIAGGSGVNTLGFPTAPVVLVDSDNAERARRIAMKFDGRHDTPSSDARDENGDNGSHDVPDAWPRCPECDVPRTTKCPICHTTGHDFDLPDAEFSGDSLPATPQTLELLEAAGLNGMTATGCSCGPGGCGSAEAGANASGHDPCGSDECASHGQGPAGSGPADDGPEGSDGAPAQPFMLVCPTCDEMFTPDFPRQCEWCGNQFDEGYVVEVKLQEPVGAKAMFVAIGLTVLLIAGAVYFVAIM